MKGGGRGHRVAVLACARGGGTKRSVAVVAASGIVNESFETRHNRHWTASRPAGILSISSYVCLPPVGDGAQVRMTCRRVSSEKWTRNIFALIAVWIISGVVDSAHSVAQPPSSSSLPDVENAIVLNPQERVWIDKKNRRLVMDGEICLQKGALELFICPWNGKLHESIVRVHAKPSTVHAGLLALGSQSGSPVSYDEEYKPAHGEAVEIVVRWIDEKGEWQEVHGQDWIRYRDIPADDKNPKHAALIQRAEQSTGDQAVYLDQVESFWVPVHPAFTERVKKEPGHVTRPERGW